MHPHDPKKPSLKGIGAVRRQAVSVSQEDLIKLGQLAPDQPLPLLVQPAVDGVDLRSWLQTNWQALAPRLSQHGGMLFRNFAVKSVAEFEELIRAVSGELLEYSYRSTPRSQVSGRIYTSTEYPADQAIPMHNEMAYTRSWPMKIWFYALKTAEQGGETPIADSRRVFERLDPAIRERFAQKGVLYVRNYGKGIDLPWQEVFQTEDKAEVEAYCRSAGIEYTWIENDRLRTRQVCQGVARHPTSGEMVWFNQAHLFHVTSLQEEVREALLASFQEEELPRNTYYGDGAPIEAAVLDEIRRVYDEEMVVFPWQEGDILLLDNMLAAHGRMPFVGSRKTVVGMAELMQGAGMSCQRD
jgi:alpha-ketoglutarate-dependent taurine dioxygenase